MSNLTNHALGHHGDVLPKLHPTYATQTYLDMQCMSKAMDIFDINPSILDGGKITHTSRVLYDRFGEMCESDADEGINGQVTYLEQKMRTDFVEACQPLAFQMKFNRTQAIRLGERWAGVESATENGVAKWMNRRITNFAYIKLAGSAHPRNIVLNPAAADGVFVVPTTREPGAGQHAMSEVVKLLANAIANQGVSCDPRDMQVLVNQEGYSALGTGQEKLNICCGDENTMVTGKVLHSSGYSIVRDIYTPMAGQSAAGQIDYVIAMPNKEGWLPVDIDYIEWDKHLRDFYLIGDGAFGFKVPDPRVVAVAKVRYV